MGLKYIDNFEIIDTGFAIFLQKYFYQKLKLPLITFCIAENFILLMINYNNEFFYEIANFNLNCNLSIEYLIHFKNNKFTNINQFNNYIFQFFIKNGIQKLISSGNPIKTENGSVIFDIYHINNNLNKTSFINLNKLYQTKINKNSISKSQELNKPIIIKKKQKTREYLSSKPLIGLENLGPTCYMNAILQCLCNIETFVDYFFLQSTFLEQKIAEDKQNKKLCTSFKLLIDNLYPKYKTEKIKNKNIKIFYEGKKEKIKGYYDHREFKNKILQLNPLFGHMQTNDTKDLVNFLLMTLHEELNKAPQNQNIKLNGNINEEQKNKQLMFNNFTKNFIMTQQSIISDLFYALNYNMTKCSNCQTYSYNYHIYSFFVFPLKNIREYKLNNNNGLSNINNFNNDFNNFNFVYNLYANNNLPNFFMNNNFINYMNIFPNNNNNSNQIDIMDCFEFERKINFMSGDNAMYCNYCKQTCPSSMCTLLVTGPEILIIILNQDEGNQFNIKLNFTTALDLSNYIELNATGCQYELIGVITHINYNNYMAFCKEYWNNTWLKFNDTMVSPVNNFKSDVIDSSIPNLLFYKKINQ